MKRKQKNEMILADFKTMPIPAKKKEHVIFRYRFGKPVPVVCPRCQSYDCVRRVKSLLLRPEEKRTSYHLDLNPFRPFTILRSKTKVKKREIRKDVVYFFCKQCGRKFL